MSLSVLSDVAAGRELQLAEERVRTLRAQLASAELDLQRAQERAYRPYYEQRKQWMKIQYSSQPPFGSLG